MIIMNDNHIEIKEMRSSLIARGIIFLFLAVFSLSIALLPYIIKDFSDNALTFYLGGGIAFCIFATLFVFLLFKECKPDSIIVLNSRGFTDKKNIGANVEIEWTNVASVKLMGKKETPYLGITLENVDIVMAHMKKPNVEEMRENIEEGLPHIILSQREIRYPINDLKDLFVKFTREARVLKNDAPTKPKNNPFTTEDVLRAFGKLDPIEPKEELPDNKTEENVYESTEAFEQSSEPVSAEPLDTYENVNETDDEIKSIDSFYESLILKTESINTAEQVVNEVTEEENVEEEAPASQCENDSSSDNNLQNEFDELIAKARSSKISEIEKLLNEKDIPFSAGSKKENNTEPVSVKPTEEVDETTVNNENKKDGSKTDSMGNTKEFYPEIIHFDDL